MILGCLAAQCAYALPVAAAPLAICFGSGYIRMTDFVRIGIVSSIVAIVIVVFRLFAAPGPGIRCFSSYYAVLGHWFAGMMAENFTTSMFSGKEGLRQCRNKQ